MFEPYISLFSGEIFVTDVGDSALKKVSLSYDEKKVIYDCFFIHFNRNMKILWDF